MKKIDEKILIEKLNMILQDTSLQERSLKEYIIIDDMDREQIDLLSGKNEHEITNEKQRTII